MGKDILITPASALINFSGANASTVDLQIKDNGDVSFVGVSSGKEQFTIYDSISGSVMTVNNIDGDALFDVNFDATIIAGRNGSNDFVLTGTTGYIGLGTSIPLQPLHVTGNTRIDGIIYSGTTDIGTLMGGSPAGNDTQIQFNNAGAFGGSTGLTWVQSATTLTVKGDAIFDASGNTTNPIFKILGSSGELFTVTDSLTGELFAVNDSSGLPILRVISDDTVLMGNVSAPSLNSSSIKNVSAGNTVLYDIVSTGYTSAYYDYNIVGNSSARAGNMMAIWSGTSLSYTETSTSDIGSTSAVTLSVVFSGTNTSLMANSTSNNWVIKTIVRSI